MLMFWFLWVANKKLETTSIVSPTANAHHKNMVITISSYTYICMQYLGYKLIREKRRPFTGIWSRRD